MNMLRVLNYYKINYSSISPDRYRCLCPFHNDHNPSMVIYTENPERHSFCCYTCNKSGDAKHFVWLLENEDKTAFKKALNDLDLGIEGQGYVRQPEISVNEVNFVLSVKYRELGEKTKRYDTIDNQFKLLDIQLKTDKSLQSIISEHVKWIKENEQ